MKGKQRWIIYGLIVIVLGTVIFFGIRWMHRPRLAEEPITFELKWGQEIYHIGDEMVLDLMATTKKDYQIQIPNIDPPAGVELVHKEKDKPRSSWGLIQHEVKYVYKSFQPGVYDLPNVTIKYTTPTGESKEQELTPPSLLVNSLVGQDAQDIRSIKPVAKLPRDLTIYYLVAGLLIVILLVYLLIRWLKGKVRGVKETPLIPPLPAHKQAFARLQEVKTMGLLAQGDYDQYFTLLSEIVREYIENRFGSRAREMTTQEFLTTSIRKLPLDSENQYLLEVFLQQADLVKYARHIPGDQESDTAFQTAWDFVLATQPSEEGGEDDEL